MVCRWRAPFCLAAVVLSARAQRSIDDAEARQKAGSAGKSGSKSHPAFARAMTDRIVAAEI
jgi:hypothetical protein